MIYELKKLRNKMRRSVWKEECPSMPQHFPNMGTASWACVRCDAEVGFQIFLFLWFNCLVLEFKGFSIRILVLLFVLPFLENIFQSPGILPCNQILHAYAYVFLFVWLTVCVCLGMYISLGRLVSMSYFQDQSCSQCPWYTSTISMSNEPRALQETITCLQMSANISH